MRRQMIDDPVYGEHVIGEPLLLDLLSSAAVQRLGHIHQAGASYLVRPGRDLYRLAHAIGVMLLIRRLGGSLKEQAAGLIHDVSHTAFSHVADQVFDNRDETYHEHLFTDWVRDSDIPAVLERHKVDMDELLDADRWPLLEQPQPDLCADRVDYTLRDLVHVGWLTPDRVRRFLSTLTVQQGQMVVTDVNAAVWFTHQYHREVPQLFMDPRELYANTRLADAVRIALDHGLVTAADLLRTDDELLTLLRGTGRADVNEVLDELTPALRVYIDPVDIDLRGYSKARVVDPLVLVGDRAVRVSTLEPSIAPLHDEVKRKAREGIPLRVAVTASRSAAQP